MCGVRHRFTQELKDNFIKILSLQNGKKTEKKN